MQLAAMINDDELFDDYYDSHYQLTADIALNDCASFDAWDENPPENIWTPIGYYHSFDGVFWRKRSCHQRRLCRWHCWPCKRPRRGRYVCKGGHPQLHQQRQHYCGRRRWRHCWTCTAYIRIHSTITNASFEALKNTSANFFLLCTFITCMRWMRERTNIRSVMPIQA